MVVVGAAPQHVAEVVVAVVGSDGGSGLGGRLDAGQPGG